MRIAPLLSIVSAGFTPHATKLANEFPSLDDFVVSESEAREEYEKFLLKYPGSNFGVSADHAQKKFKNFHHNLARIKYYNALEQGTATYGITEFADLSFEEFQKHKTGLNLSQEQLKNRSRNLKSSNKKLRFKKSLPDNFDWTEKGVVTPVKNQGMCGSCWAFSTTGNVEGVWAKQTGQLIELSEQELVDCDQLDQGCNGGLMDNAFAEIIRIGGLETEDDYAYDAHAEQCHFEESKAKVFINGSLDIGQDENEIAEALMEHGPLAIALNAAWMQFYHGGVSHPLSYLCDPSGLDHGVLLVGFGIEDKTNWRHWHPRPYWKIKNSWGPNWGEDGYYRIYRGEGVCGVNQYVTTSIIDPPKTTTTTTTTTATTTTETTTTATTITETDSTTSTEATTEISSMISEEDEFLEAMTEEEIASLVEKLQELDLEENNDVF